MTTASMKPWVRGGGQVIAVALVGYLLWSWPMRQPARSEPGASATTATPATREPPVQPVPVQPLPAPAAALEQAEPALEPAAQPPAAPAQPSAADLRAQAQADLRAQAQEVRLGVEHEGDFGVLYEKWYAETEDPAATQNAMKWVEQRMLALDVVPDASFLSCRQTLCRLGLGFEDSAQLHRLTRIEIPRGLDPKISEVFEFPEANMNAIVVYWSAGALPPPSPAE